MQTGQLFPTVHELTLIPAQSFPVGFSCAEKLYNFSAGNNQAGIKVNSAEKPEL